MGNLTTSPNKYADFKAVSDQARAELDAETQLGSFPETGGSRDLVTPPPDPAPAPPAPPAPPALPTWLGPVALGLSLLLAIRSK